MSIIWSCLALVNPGDMQSHGYSVSLSLENLGLVVFPYVIGKIHDDTD
jgi:hypothetical protein